MGVLGKIFGTEAAVKEVVSTVASGLDALVYTEEEKANDAKAERSEARKVVVAWMETTKGQNLARRLIALCITGVWLLLFLIGAGIDVSAVFVSAEKSTQLQAVSAILALRVDRMTGAVMLILAFYFAAPHMGGIVEAALHKFGGKEASPTPQPVAQPSGRPTGTGSHTDQFADIKG